MHKYNNRSQMFADWDDAMDVITTGFYGQDAVGSTTGYCGYGGFNEFQGFEWDVSDAAPGYGTGYTKRRNVSEIDTAYAEECIYGAGVVTPVRAQGNGAPWVSYTEEPGTATWNIKIRKEIPLEGSGSCNYENETVYYWDCVDSWDIIWDASGTQPEHLYVWTKLEEVPYQDVSGYVVLTASDNPKPGDTVYMCDYFDVPARICNVEYDYPNGVKHFYKGIVTYNCK